MKKLLLILAIGAFAACNDGTTTEAKNDSATDKIDSTSEVKKDMIDSTAEVKKDMVDSAAKMAKDTLKK